MSPTSPAAEGHRYDAFISYSTAADYRLARALEGFLEYFHRIKTPGIALRPLSVCVDGSDFSMASVQRKAAGKSTEERLRALELLLEEHLASSKYLVVLCAGPEYESSWRDFELAWWQRNRDDASIFLAVTRGVDPARDSERFFSARVLAAGLHHRVWFDFRGYAERAARRLEKVRSYDDERMRLAAELYGMTLQQVQPIWFREQRRRARAWLAAAVVATILFSSLATFAWFQRGRAQAATGRSTVDAERARAQAAIAEEERLVAEAHRVDDVLDAPGGWLDGLPAAMAASVARLGVGTNPPPLQGALARAAFAAVPIVEVPASALGSAPAISDKGGFFVTADVTGNLRVWNARTGDPMATATAPDSFRWVEVTSEGDALVTAGRSGARIWSVRPLKTRCLIPCARNMLSAQLSHDSRLMLTTCTDGTHGVYDVGSCRLIAALDGRRSSGGARRSEERYAINFPYAASFAPDGETVAVPAIKHGFAVWTLGEKPRARVFGVDRPRVLAAIFARNAARVLAMQEGNTASVWDVSGAGRVLRTLRASSAAISPDGTSLIVDGDRAPHLVQVGSGRQSPALAGPNLEQPAFSDDGERVMAIGGDGVTRVWDTTTGDLLIALRGRTPHCDGASISRDGSRLATSSRDGAVRLWDIGETAPRHDDIVRMLRFSNDGTRLVSGAWSGQVKLWDPARDAAVAVIPAHESEVFAAAFSRDGGVLATASAGQVHVIDGHTGHPLAELALGDATIGSVDVSPDGTRVVTAELTGPPRLWDAQTGALVEPIAGVEATFATFATDERLLLRRRPSSGDASEPGGVVVWNVRTGRRELELRDDGGALEEIAVSPNGARIASVQRRGAVRTARIWGLDGSSVPLAADVGPVRAESFDATAVFSADGRSLATFTLDPDARLWDTETGRLQAMVHVRGAQVDAAEIFDHNERLATHDSSGVARIWNAKTGDPIGALDDVSMIRVSPDGSRIAAASGRRLRFFETNERSVFARGCQVLEHMRDIPELTPAQRTLIRQACLELQNR